MLGAAGMLPGYAQTNLGMASLAPQVGQGSVLLQRSPYDILNSIGMQRQMIPWEMLSRYMDAVRGDYGRQGSETTTGRMRGFGIGYEDLPVK